jgi:hypothetical protein
MKEPWQMSRAELVPFSATFPISHLQDAGPRSYSEADLHAYALYRRACETIPPCIPDFAEGTWSIDCWGGLWQLRRSPIKALIFPGGDPYAREWGWSSDMQPWLIEKYVAWLRAGHEPPPLRGFETEQKHIKVSNGHNRAAALVRVERHEVLIWISLAYTKPNGFCTDLTHSLAVEAALRSGKPVPLAVLAEYIPSHPGACCLTRWPDCLSFHFASSASSPGYKTCSGAYQFVSN